MKIITMISSLPPIVGLSAYTKGLVNALKKTNKIHFLGFNHIYPSFLYPGKLKDESATILEKDENLDIKNILDWFNPFGWILEAFRIKTKIIHAQWWSFPLAPIYITILGINKLRGKKIILTVHNVLPHEKSFLKIFLNKSIFSLANEFIVHTKQNKDELEKIVKNKPIHIIPHGIIELSLKGITKKEARKALQINDSDKILLCFGHIRNYKGLDTALKALALIKDPSIKLLIAGKCWEDWSKYENLIDFLKIKDRLISKVGFIPSNEIETIFKASDLVLLPYKHFDAQSGVGAQVLPFGIPMIVSNTGGLPEYVKDKNCIISPNKPEELAEKAEKILSDSVLYSKILDDLKIVVKTLSWDTIAEKTNLVYEKFF